MSDGEGGPAFPDDEVPDRASMANMRRKMANPLNQDVPRVVDIAGNKVMEAFQHCELELVEFNGRVGLVLTFTLLRSPRDT